MAAWHRKPQKDEKPVETFRIYKDDGWEDFDKMFKFGLAGDEATLIKMNFNAYDDEYYLLFENTKLQYNLRMPNEKGDILIKAPMYILDIGTDPSDGRQYIEIGIYTEHRQIRCVLFPYESIQQLSGNSTKTGEPAIFRFRYTAVVR